MEDYVGDRPKKTLQNTHHIQLSILTEKGKHKRQKTTNTSQFSSAYSKTSTNPYYLSCAKF